MPIRNPKPTSPGRRFVTYPDFAEVESDAGYRYQSEDDQ